MSSFLCGRQLAVPGPRRGRVSRLRTSGVPWLWCVLLLLACCVLLLVTGGDAGGKAKKQRKRKGRGGKTGVKLTPTPSPTKTSDVMVPAPSAEAPKYTAPRSTEPTMASQSTEPAVASQSTEPAVASQSTEPAVASQSTEPAVASQSTQAGTPTPQADAQSPQLVVAEPVPLEAAVSLEDTAVLVDEFFSKHALVVRTLGGMARTLERCQSGKGRTSAVKDVQQQLNPSFTLDALLTTINAIRVMVDALVGSGQCSTFFHRVPTGSTWVVYCWTGLLVTYHEPATFVIPHVLLGWPLPARPARPGWDWLALDPLPPLTRRQRTVPVEGADFDVRDKQRIRHKKAKELAKARGKVVKEYAKAVRKAQQLQDKAIKQFLGVNPEKETADEYEGLVELAEEALDAAAEGAKEDLKHARLVAGQMRDDAEDSSNGAQTKANKDAVAWIRAAEAAYKDALARAQKAYEAAEADADRWRKKAIREVMTAAKATRAAAYAEAQAMEARARTAMDEAIAELEFEYKDAILPPTSLRMSVDNAAASTPPLDGPTASRVTLDFDFAPVEPDEVTDLGLVPAQPGFFFEAPSSTTDVKAFTELSFQEQYMPYGYGLPFDSDVCANALHSGDLCTYACCESRMLGTASCEPTAMCY
ncbi:hypothetical protein I4F81_000883 [Pyropia yezoensis]|uniref:Uncharacterized protein n=1 Tax=Pyropia yezoensis TaxID=2788 RepID=A0ACC3BL13_PYRYE|nr:hypothetical protein I4F81_000883 [Neopyropia yezoensis]|eukprot:contig_27546_g6777